MLQEITQRVFCSRVFSLASLFEVLLILKFFDSVRYLLALASVSVEFTYMGFSLLLVVHFMGFFKNRFMQQASPLEFIHCYGNLSPKP